MLKLGLMVIEKVCYIAKRCTNDKLCKLEKSAQDKNVDITLMLQPQHMITFFVESWISCKLFPFDAISWNLPAQNIFYFF